MKKNIILTIVVSLIGSIVAMAQPEFEEGWVATTSGDTLYGKLKVLDPASSCAKVHFLNAQGERIKVKGKRIAGYQRGEELYVSKPTVRPISIGGGPNGLMHLLRTGPKVTLYTYNYTTQSGGFGPGQVSFSNTQSDYYIERHGKLRLVYRSGFKRNMSAYFADDPFIGERISKKTYRYEDMEEIVKEYNYRARTQDTEGQKK